MSSEKVAQQALDRALDEKEDLLLVYQPIHETRTRKIRAAEALLRQRRQNGEIREASIITETAEQGPELFELDSLTVRSALDDGAQWMKRAPDVRLNVNLSPREFQEGNIVERLQSFVAGCHIDMTRINLEITETTYIDEPEETMQVLQLLKKMGVQLWLDDFGTGHSSLTHLHKFPLDGIKIPKDFIEGIGADRRGEAIARSLIRLAHELRMEVIAEGVETNEQLDFLLELECDYIQGFLFSRPMLLEEFERLL